MVLPLLKFSAETSPRGPQPLEGTYLGVKGQQSYFTVVTLLPGWKPPEGRESPHTCVASTSWEMLVHLQLET